MLARIRQMVIKEFIQSSATEAACSCCWPLPNPTADSGLRHYFEVRHLSTAVLDLDTSIESRDLVARFAASRYFDVRARLSDREQFNDLVRRGEIAVALHIHPGFGAICAKGSRRPCK